ncbi:MAG: hypothetical protein CL916_11775 [Deltaproteobacteria bacterium]|nr:hypothetical protein [Deltaproteobacteria bacterium]
MIIIGKSTEITLKKNSENIEKQTLGTKIFVQHDATEKSGSFCNTDLQKRFCLADKKIVECTA